MGRLGGSPGSGGDPGAMGRPLRADHRRTAQQPRGFDREGVATAATPAAIFAAAALPYTSGGGVDGCGGDVAGKTAAAAYRRAVSARRLPAPCTRHDAPSQSRRGVGT